eukprot:3153874-Amphidinium_carterae.4
MPRTVDSPRPGGESVEATGSLGPSKETGFVGSLDQLPTQIDSAVAEWPWDQRFLLRCRMKLKRMNLRV